jgi:serine/threonine protein phosphatase PrpC
VDSDCIHDVPWLVRHLAAAITEGLMLTAAPLADILAEAIRLTGKAHASTCDMSNPDGPSSTVAMVRVSGEQLDYLVLGDSQLALRRGQEILPVHDDRTDHLPGGRPYSPTLVRQCRNAPGGFWVASTNVQAAYEALSGSAEGVTEAVLATDGITRLLDFYSASWWDIFPVLRAGGGPSALIRQVRRAENQSPLPHGKRHDDATVIYTSDVHVPAGACVVPDPLVMVR